MILRSQQITVGKNQLTNVMLNLIDEHQMRFKMTLDEKPYDFYIRNWYAEMKNFNIQVIVNGIEVPSKLPVQIILRVDILKKGVTISGKFLENKINVKTTIGGIFQELLKLLKKH